MSIVERLQEFIENEARSCSMDFGCVTPLYVYRMWGGAVALEEIETAMKICLRAGGADEATAYGGLLVCAGSGVMCRVIARLFSERGMGM